MKKILYVALTALFVALIAFLYECGSNSKKNEEPSGSSPIKGPIQLNVSILLDLSDRVIQPMQPAQSERDIEIVSVLINVFKKGMQSKGAYQAKDKIQILFNPTPTDSNINNIAKQLNVDLSKMDNKQKKVVYDNIEKDFEQGLREIYDLTLKTKKWVGSDIWRFFKRDAQELCIENDTNYRNILIIVTDGYLYHTQSLYRQNNRTAFITGIYLQKEGFRNNPNWQAKFDSKDYGLIFSGQTFENLEVMVLEVNSSSQHKNDEDIIRAFLDKWFEEMKIKNAVIYNTDLPANTKRRIENFFKN
jgi:hypothetical protein